ncbi:methyl-accepting chemotaxis protein [Intestinirhabdus alba]|jgi:methyl-accepting chemotaxis protein-1 (serine sensor receptor)|nr:methyl-accepting chemotaxis protein [Intestinirhabdus alba]
MKISTTIISIPLAMMLCAIAFSVTSLSMADKTATALQVSSDMSNQTNKINEIRYNLSMMRGSINTLDADIEASRKPTQKYIDDYQRRRKLTEQALLELDQLHNTRYDDIIDRSQALIKIYDFSMSQILNLQNATTSTSSKLSEITNLIREEIGKAERERIDFINGAERAVFTLKIFAFIFVLLSLCLFGFSLYIAKAKIVRRLNALAVDIGRISKGDLSKKLTNFEKNEIGDIFSHVEAMRQSLVTMISTIKGNVYTIGNSSSELTTGNNDLSSRTEEQASALQETAASMEQIKITVENNTDNAKQANVLAADARRAANNGAEVMKNAIASMERIEKSASQIAEITDVINGIASQTNILALNAAVEAARAGEQGRGFAVVSSEVRSLAARSAEAAKEINNIIRTSVDEIELGTGLVNEAGDGMQNIVQYVTQFSDLMQEISLASEEQKTGIGQVAVAINQMDSTTQQNAALVEQAAAATASLDDQARHLNQMIAVFNTEEVDEEESSFPSFVRRPEEITA